MKCNSSPSSELKKVTWELASYKIELHKTTGYLQCILQNATDLIFATDAEGLLISFSKGGEKVLGYSWEEVVGRPIKAVAEEPLSVNSNTKLLEQVFMNCLANAIHAVIEKGGDNGRIEIRTVNNNSEVEISVADNGVGIPKEDQGKIITSFIRPNSREREPA